MQIWYLRICPRLRYAPATVACSTTVPPAVFEYAECMDMAGHQVPPSGLLEVTVFLEPGLEPVLVVTSRHLKRQASKRVQVCDYLNAGV